MKAQHIIALITSLLENLFFSGAVIGWPSLQYVLLKENYFANFCNNVSLNSFQNASDHYEAFHGNKTEILFCPERDSIINLALALAFSMQYFVSYLSGAALDKCGTWMFRILASGLIFIAYLLLALSSPQNSWLVFLAMSLLSIGGLMIGTSNNQLALLVKPFKGLILSLQAGAFSSAAIVFLLVKEIHKSGASIFSVFVTMAMASTLTCLRTFTLLPKGIISENVNPSLVRYGWKEWTCSSRDPNLCEADLSDKKSITVVEGSPSDNSKLLDEKNELEKSKVPCRKIRVDRYKPTSYKQSYRSLLFWSNLFTFSAGHLRQIFFMGSFVNWIQEFAKDKTENLIDFFNIFFLVAILGSFLSGIMFDSVAKFYKSRLSNSWIINQKASCSVMLINSTLLTLISIFVLFRLAYLSVIFSVLSQSFVYGGNWTFISVTFPAKHYGKLLGLTQVFGGVSSLISYGLFCFSVHFDPHFTYVNVALLVLSCVTFFHPFVIYKKSCLTNRPA